MIDSGEPRLQVFISYSRNDLAFAEQVTAALDMAGFRALIDRGGIAGGEEWRGRLETLIRQADTFVFVLSPDSAKSEICSWEAEEAARLGKRIIPIVCRPMDSSEIPSRLISSLNYIYFYADPKVPGSGFGVGLSALAQALRTDMDWVREHTRLAEAASRWAENGRTQDLLLKGQAVGEARQWLQRQPRDGPQPSDLHRAFIAASEDAAHERELQARREVEVSASGERGISELAAALNAREAELKAWAKALEAREASLATESAGIGRSVRLSRPPPAPRGTKIFISYRRSSSLHIAGRMCDRLEKEFTHGEVFFDVDAIPVGTNFKEHIRGSLERSAVLLAVIGANWSSLNWSRTRLRNLLSLAPEDHVQSEIELAFELGVPITPVLIDQTTMPTRSVLPRSLADLCHLNAASVRGGRDFHSDMETVCKMIRELRSRVEAGVRLSS